jgi:hypothetical protein
MKLDEDGRQSDAMDVLSRHRRIIGDQREDNLETVGARPQSGW